MSVLPDDSPAATTVEHGKVFVVLNPMAGSSDAATVRAALERHFSSSGRNYEVYETTGDEKLADIVRAALDQGATIVVAAGGDGTVSEVANVLVGTDAALGILPVGTANVLARELGIPFGLDGAVNLIAGENRIEQIDAMQVGDQFFVLQIGIGLDSLMIRDTDRASKRRFGQVAYLWTLFTRLAGFQPLRFTVIADGVRSRPRAAQVLIANGGTLGVQFLRWGPDITPDDGKIDVCIVSTRTLIDYLGLIWHTVLRQQRRNRNVRYLQAQRSIVVSADRPLPIQADGEIIGETPVHVTVVPHAVKVILPATIQAPAASSE